MTIVNKKEPFLLGFGDLVILTVSLWLTLAVRYQAVPSSELWSLHIEPFSVVFAISIIAFYAAGLYGRHHTVIRRAVIPGIVFKTQIVNTLIAVLLFYFVPTFSVTPKLNLFIYFAVSSVAITLWRFLALPLLRLQRKNRGIVIASDQSGKELHQFVQVQGI
jgi:FlaA1/EpsC-like NDP-sugar epimerase